MQKKPHYTKTINWNFKDNLKNLENKKRQLPQNLLKEEIIQLQKELEAHKVVRSALEKAMNHQPLFHDTITYESLSQPAENLIKEIAILESEVVYLEKYLLSMYRKNFSKRLSTLPAILDERPKEKTETHNLMSSKANLPASVNEDSKEKLPIKCNEISGSEMLVDTGIHRSHSSLSHHSAYSLKYPYETEEAFEPYHSLPLSMLERAEYIGSSSHPFCVRETPNWLSEEMIRCISTIYCHLSEENSSSYSSTSWMNNSFNVEEFKEYSGSLFTMVEVKGLLRDSSCLKTVEDLLQNFRILVSRLAQIDPGKLKHEEKLAFWINVHNALVMHAFLVYGIPRGNLKRISLALKAAYNIGGHTISVETIQSCILRYRLPRPSQWLHSLLYPKAKFKVGDHFKAYAIKHLEPRLRFALCSGCQSDAAVRIYTSKNVFQELEMAKEEYVQMNIKVHKEQRLLVPKNIEYFVKEMGLSSSAIVMILEHSLPDSLKKNLIKKSEQGKIWKRIDWIPHNFSFRFLFSNELVN